MSLITLNHPQYFTQNSQIKGQMLIYWYIILIVDNQQFKPLNMRCLSNYFAFCRNLLTKW